TRLDAKWATAIAAIHYGIPPQRALQVLIEPELVASIANANADVFTTLSKVPGFLQVLERTIELRAGSMEPEFLTNAMLLIRQANITPSPRIEAIRRVLKS